jgi:HEAT repeat protein
MRTLSSDLVLYSRTIWAEGPPGCATISQVTPSRESERAPPREWPPTFNGEPVPFGTPVEELDRIIATSGHTERRWACFVALAQHGSPASLASLRRHAASAEEHVRRAAIEAIGRHALGAELAELVCAALDDPSPLVVRTACESAAGLGLHDAHNAILRWIRAADPSTQVAALQAIARLWRAPDDFRAVLDVFVTTGNRDVRSQAAWTLYKTASADGWRELFHHWHVDRLAQHRTWACRLAGAFGPGEVARELRGMARDPNGHVRKAAARALCAME